jgi:tRNA (guanine-N(7)-)-methyltransferase (EC 2.1.1.33)
MQADTEAVHRPIRSFVRREGRLTPAQASALATLLPRYGVPTGDGPLDLDALFGRRAPRVLEIGFGAGEQLLARAAAEPQHDFLGIEVHRPGIGRLLHEAERLDLGNLRVAGEDAVELLRRRLPAASITELLLYFPDPWPKKRHHKRRIVQPEFAALVARALPAGGLWRLATDWADYAAQMREVLDAAPDFVNAGDADGYATRPDSRPPTRFERRGERLGHAVFDLLYRRR